MGAAAERFGREGRGRDRSGFEGSAIAALAGDVEESAGNGEEQHDSGGEEPVHVAGRRRLVDLRERFELRLRRRLGMEEPHQVVGIEV